MGDAGIDVAQHQIHVIKQAGCDRCTHSRSPLASFAKRRAAAKVAKRRARSTSASASLPQSSACQSSSRLAASHKYWRRRRVRARRARCQRAARLASVCSAASAKSSAGQHCFQPCQRGRGLGAVDDPGDALEMDVPALLGARSSGSQTSSWRRWSGSPSRRGSTAYRSRRRRAAGDRRADRARRHRSHSRPGRAAESPRVDFLALLRPIPRPAPRPELGWARAAPGRPRVLIARPSSRTRQPPTASSAADLACRTASSAAAISSAWRAGSA